jgi:hypothetical protein
LRLDLAAAAHDRQGALGRIVADGRRRLPAEKALEWGLVNRVHDDAVSDGGGDEARA